MPGMLLPVAVYRLLWYIQTMQLSLGSFVQVSRLYLPGWGDWPLFVFPIPVKPEMWFSISLAQ